MGAARPPECAVGGLGDTSGQGQRAPRPSHAHAHGHVHVHVHVHVPCMRTACACACARARAMRAGEGALDMTCTCACACACACHDVHACAYMRAGEGALYGVRGELGHNDTARLGRDVPRAAAASALPCGTPRLAIPTSPFVPHAFLSSTGVPSITVRSRP